LIYSKSFLSYYPYRLLTSWLFYCVESRSRCVLKFFKFKYSFVRKICSAVKVVGLKICNLLRYTHFFVKSIFHFKNRGKPILWVQNQKSEETFKGNNSKSFWSISKLFSFHLTYERALYAENTREAICHEFDPICGNFHFSTSLGQEKILWERFGILHGETRKHNVFKKL